MTEKDHIRSLGIGSGTLREKTRTHCDPMEPPQPVITDAPAFPLDQAMIDLQNILNGGATILGMTAEWKAAYDDAYGIAPAIPEEVENAEFSWRSDWGTEIFKYALRQQIVARLEMVNFAVKDDAVSVSNGADWWGRCVQKEPSKEGHVAPELLNKRLRDW